MLVDKGVVTNLNIGSGSREGRVASIVEDAGQAIWLYPPMVNCGGIPAAVWTIGMRAQICRAGRGASQWMRGLSLDRGRLELDWAGAVELDCFHRTSAGGFRDACRET